MKTQTCPCCPRNLFSECCEPFIIGTKIPSTALALMRSRYTAYVLHNADYLIKTTHISERKHFQYMTKKLNKDISSDLNPVKRNFDK
jgi:uncharacterized protein YchJ